MPVYLAAVGPKNLELAGEIADGWLGIFNSPATLREQLDPSPPAGRRLGNDLAGFDVVASAPA